MGEFLDFTKFGWNNDDDEDLNDADLQGLILSGDEYRMLIDLCKAKNATVDQAMKTVRQFEEARVSEIMLELINDGKIEIKSWVNDEPAFGNVGTPTIDLSAFSRN